MVATLAVLVILVAVAAVAALAGGSGSPGRGPVASAAATPAVATPAARRSPSTPVGSSPSTRPAGAARPVVAYPAAPPMDRSAPTRLRIPAIDVDSDLMPLGLNADGTLETPPGPFPAGWFTEGPAPGQIGPAIIVGHVRYNTPGVFARLAELRPGDEIRVDRTDASTAVFRVRRVQHVTKSAFPTKAVYGNLDHAGLRLVTCAGLDTRSEVFEENLVVFADLVAD